MADPCGFRRDRDENGTPEQPKLIPLLLDERSCSSPDESNMSTESFMFATPSSVLSHFPTEAVLLLFRGGSHILELPFLKMKQFFYC